MLKIRATELTFCPMLKTSLYRWTTKDLRKKEIGCWHGETKERRFVTRLISGHLVHESRGFYARFRAPFWEHYRGRRRVYTSARDLLRVCRASRCARRGWVVSLCRPCADSQENSLSFPHSQGAASHTSLRLLVFCASNIAGVNTNNSFDRKNGRGTHTEKRSYRILTAGSHGIFYACPEGCRRKSILFPSFFPLIPYSLFLCRLINFNNNLFDFDETRADYNFFNRFLI